MNSVGIRELKAHLSRHLKGVQAGARLVVTERGRQIATISPIPPPEAVIDLSWAHALVNSGRAAWAGGKPGGVPRPVTLQSGPSLSESILDNRR